MKPMSRQNLHAIIAILFIISGALGLIYQIVWFKYLSLFIGNTTYAQTIVLATFMGGLAIGSALWGRKVDKTKNPLRLYAILEICIGAYCILYPSILEFLKTSFISIVVSSQLSSDGNAVLLLKLFTSLISLLIPTILMGGTLPILVRFISNKIEESGRNIAILYFLNSFGAIIGSILAGFFFIRLVGLNATINATAVISIVIGLVAYGLTKIKIQVDAEENVASKIEETTQQFSKIEIILAIMVAGLSGLAAMIYEVTWVRLLIPVIGSSTYSFSLMLAAFISGITLGSLIVSSLVQKIKNLSAFLAWCQIGIVISMIATLPLYGRIPYEFWKIASLLSRSESTYPIYLSIQFIFGFVLMLIPTIFLGMSLPIATRIAARGINVLGKSVGNVFAINTLGTVIGSLLAGLILIPIIGIKHAIEVGIIINLLAGVSVMIFSGAIPKKIILVALPIITVLVATYFLFAPNWNQGIMLSGVFRKVHSQSRAPKSYSEFLNQHAQYNILYYKEGSTATIGVVETPFNREPQKILIVNGKADASTKGDLPTQLLCGHLPVLLHKNPENVLVVGLGSGVTVGSALTHPIKKIDCIEISPEIVEAEKYFESDNNKPFKDPRSTLYIEDALAYLKISQKKYDVIISEPTNPWIAGVGNLFTDEYFKACKKRMTKGGTMLQWFHLYENNDELFQMIVRTFQYNFKYVSVWQPLSTDLIMVGSEEPINIDYDDIKTRISKQEVKKDLARININDAATLLSIQMLSPKSVYKYIGYGPINTENHPILEYGAPSAFYSGNGSTQILKYDERFMQDTVNIPLQKLMQDKKITDTELANIGFFHHERLGNIRFGYAILSDLYKRRPNDIKIVEKLAKITRQINLNSESAQLYKKLTELNPSNHEYLSKYAWIKYLNEKRYASTLTPQNFKESEEYLNKAISLVKDTVDVYRLFLADIYYGSQDYKKALENYAKVLKIRETYNMDPNIKPDAVLMQIARCNLRLNKIGDALNASLQASNVNKQNEEAKDLFYEIWMRQMNKK